MMRLSEEIPGFGELASTMVRVVILYGHKRQFTLLLNAYRSGRSKTHYCNLQVVMIIDGGDILIWYQPRAHI